MKLLQSFEHYAKQLDVKMAEKMATQNKIVSNDDEMATENKIVNNDDEMATDNKIVNNDDEMATENKIVNNDDEMGEFIKNLNLVIDGEEKIQVLEERCTLLLEELSWFGLT